MLKHSILGIIKSGTSTLEAGYFQLPFAVVYKTNALTYLIGKNLAKIQNIAMANIILGKTVVPELIQNDVNSDKIYSVCKQLLVNKTNFDLMKQQLGEIKNKLGAGGASKRAAEIIYAAMNES